MSSETPVLHMLCGKIAAGKSTLAGRLARAPATVVISEDAWLAALFSGEMTSGADYLRCSHRLRQAIGPHVTGLLKAGISVVLDFPANTVQNRAWMRSLLEGTGAAHQLHLLRAGAGPLQVLQQLRRRGVAQRPVDRELVRLVVAPLVPPRRAP